MLVSRGGREGLTTTVTRRQSRAVRSCPHTVRSPVVGGIVYEKLGPREDLEPVTALGRKRSTRGGSAEPSRTQ